MSRIYIGGLPADASRREVEREFEYFGPLRDVWVARNPPGFGFIVFDDTRDAEDAVRDMDGRRVCGSRVRVEMARGPTRGGRSSRPNRDLQCYECGRFGHTSRQCTRKGEGYRRRRSRSRSRERKRSYSRSPRRSRSRSRSRSRKDEKRRDSPNRSASRERDHSRSASQERSRKRSRSGSVSKSRSHSRSPSPVRDNGEEERDKKYVKDQEDDANRDNEKYENEN